MWQWRKILRAGPVKVVLSKTGWGWSINLGFFRYGHSTQGVPYVSFGVPGTGLYFIKYLGPRSRENSAVPESSRSELDQVADHRVTAGSPSSKVPTPNQALLEKIKKM